MDDDGRTPLHRAAKEGHKDVAELLIAKGANVNAVDKEGRTPISTARPFSPWLKDYLAEACSKNLCTKIVCTTCGALEFRRGFYARAANALGRKDDRLLFFDPAMRTELIRQLAQLGPPDGQTQDWMTAAVRLVFYEGWLSIFDLSAEPIREPMLEGTWALSVFHAMQEYDRDQMEERTQYELFNSPEAIKARRDATRKLRQEQHAERLARKKELDRLWFEKHPREGL